MTQPHSPLLHAARGYVQAAFATEGRDLGLDVLRAAAIAMVMVHHGVSVRGLPVLGAFGTGVDLFFVLSGFLIGRIFYRSRLRSNFSLLEFWQARWLRTLPPYFAMLGLYTWLEGFPGGSYLLFLQNYAGVSGLGISWSLCVEEQFYLVFPLLALLADRMLARRFVPVVLFLATLAPLALRLWRAGTEGGLPAGWWFQTHLHAEGLAVGVSLAWLAVESPGSLERLRPWAKLLLLPGAVALALEPVYGELHPWLQLGFYTVLAYSYGALLLLLTGKLEVPTGRFGRLAARAIGALALASYSLYLTHTTVDSVVRNEWLASWPRGVLKTAAVFAACGVAGIAFFLLVERPAILLRSWLQHAGTSAKARGRSTDAVPGRP